MDTFKLMIRRLARKPAFTLLAVLTLAVGLGANAAIFTLVDAVLIRPLPYPEADRLVAVEHAAPGLDLMQMNMSGRLYLHYLEHAESFETLGLYDEGSAAVSGLDRPVEVGAATVTPSVFRVLRLEPAKGRRFLDQEGAPGGAKVVLVSHGFWQNQLGGDPAVLGRTLEVDGTSREIVGVMAPDFAFPNAEVELWLPEVIDPDNEPLGSFGREGIARLRDGVGIEQAGAELELVARELEQHFPDDRAATVLVRGDFTAQVVPFREAVVGDIGSMLWILLATVGLVLLLACFNVANLFLARCEEGQRETAIRAALGASRARLAAASLGEALLLSTGAAVLGLVLGHFGLQSILRLAPGRLPRIDEVVLGPRIVVVVVLLALVSGIVFGLIPVLRGGLRQLATQLRDGGRSSTLGRGRHRARRLLVASQMAIAIVLLIGAGLMVRSFQQIARVDPGFDSDGALTFRLSLPEGKAEHDLDIAHFYDRLLERLTAIPGVESAATASSIPLTGRGNGSGHRFASLIRPDDDGMPLVFSVQTVSPGYFHTLGVPLLEGRTLVRADWESRRCAVVVSETVARRHFPDQSIVGQRIFPGTPDEDQPWCEVVGVVGDVRAEGLTEDPPPTVYYSWVPSENDMWSARAQTIVLRTSGVPEALLPLVRQTVWSLDADLPLAEVETLDDLVRRSRARSAFTAILLLLAAAVAVILGAVGTYGVISYLVAQRRSEIGIRMALGARRADVLGMVLSEGLLLTALGTAAGLALAAVLARGLDAVLFGVSPWDPLTFALVPVLLALVATLACLVPARRAAGIAPTVALRHE